MPSYSETILSNQSHPGDSTTETVTGEKYKGDGYYGRADGFHTVQYNVTGFSGTVKMQGTLATVPVDADYFDISGTEETGTTGSFFKNFTGNYVWVRAVVIYTDGTVQSILLNH
jgi:hypothetical protein|tara:strand:- start:1074 stop:1415 length:342 start_codon:yes stop_codon:yes gene_type:complete